MQASGLDALRACVRLILREAYEESSVFYDLVETRPGSKARQACAWDLINAATSGKASVAVLRLYSIACDLAGIDGELLLALDASYGGLADMYSSSPTPQLARRVRKVKADWENARDAAHAAILSLQAAELEDAVARQVASETEVDYRPRVTMPEDYYAL